jgi:hypothetical protein
MRNDLIASIRDLYGVAAFRLRVRVVVVLLLLVATAACGAYRFPSATPAGTGTVSGQVLALPCAPAEPVTPTCSGRPVAGLEIDFAAGGTTAIARTDAKGAYSIDLAPGTWTVTLTGHWRVIKGQSTVTVAAGSSVVADFFVDSGIRIAAQ